MAGLTDDQLDRYGRQILLPRLGVEGQQELLAARVLLIGAGGLGAPASMYLAGAGVGELTVADDDEVAVSNLHRQVLHTESRVGWNKAESAAAALYQLNPGVEVRPLAARLDGEDLDAAVAGAGLVVDASDNFDTRYAVNAACLRHGRTLVTGAVIRMEGQVTVFPFGAEGGPCYRCLYREAPDAGETERCSVTGVLGPAAGMIGTTMAAEAIKRLAGIGEGLAGRLLLVDALAMDFRTIRLARDPQCPACSAFQPAS
ncbi:HesA/MoeB/ThiF family protein [Thiohalorhabdus denitrificans]|uniref:Molybdopterin-synthase adenylyltransferase n=1 Tax=Thiohalorhabdus denitrificans TaxID=381306 RepID=A0A1G5EL05_9GAMM|nr:molybdopterin-synthase adenylyltransferase MoeB [Thiohalorhabdus denitrificans]SCY27128.1 adenylyltransferase and sulfurtransferase [Thiohalorhabdus denitrificans]